MTGDEQHDPALVREERRARRVARSIIDITGQRFGRLVAVELVEHDRRNRQARWVVKCDCGTVKEVNGQSLRNGSIKSCGCLQRERVEAARARHVAIRQAEARGIIPPGSSPMPPSAGAVSRAPGRADKRPR